MSATAPAPAAPKETRDKTTYVILREKPVSGQDVALVYEPVESGVAANSSEHALRQWAEKQKAGVGGTYVAISSRSFKPTKVSFLQQTVVKLA